MGIRIDWSDEENLAICLAYCIMLQAQTRGDKFNKSQIRRELIGTDVEPGILHRRSNGSLEAKLMNCSAVAVNLGLGIVKGYKPAPNYQSSLSYAMSSAAALVADDTAHCIKTHISVATS